MSSVPQGIGQQKDYDSRTAALAFNGAAVTDRAQFGWSGSKGHEGVYTLDNNYIVVHNVPDITGTIGVNATSDFIPVAIAAWKNEDVVSASWQAPDDAGYSGMTFRYVTITDVEQGDTSTGEMPDVTIDFMAGDME